MSRRRARSTRARVSLVATAITCLGLGVPGCGSGPAPVDCGGCGPCSATVARVVDGDTIELGDGNKVRYLLVDAPETTKGKSDCYGFEAAAFNTQSVSGMAVNLAYDPSQCRDVFGRLLAYVSVDGREVNSLLVERGYACVLFLPPAGTSREVEFKTLQASAKAGKAGVWGSCTPVTCAQ